MRTRHTYSLPRTRHARQAARAATLEPTQPSGPVHTYLLIARMGERGGYTSSLVATCGEWYAEAVYMGRTCGVRLYRRVEWRPGFFRWEKREARLFCGMLLNSKGLPADARAAALALAPGARRHTYAESLDEARLASELVGATAAMVSGGPAGGFPAALAEQVAAVERSRVAA